MNQRERNQTNESAMQTICIPSVNPYREYVAGILLGRGLDPILREQFGEFVVGMSGDIGEHIFEMGK